MHKKQDKILVKINYDSLCISLLFLLQYSQEPPCDIKQVQFSHENRMLSKTRKKKTGKNQFFVSALSTE